MRISEICCFDYTKEIGFCEEIASFGKEEMTYFAMAISTPKIHVNTTPTQFSIPVAVSRKIRESAILKLDQLKNISEILATNSPKYIRITCEDGTKNYYEYSNEFCSIFRIAKIFAPQEKEQESPCTIQKIDQNQWIHPALRQQSAPAPTQNPSTAQPMPNGYTPVQQSAAFAAAKKKKRKAFWIILALALVAWLVVFAVMFNEEDTGSNKDNTMLLDPVEEPESGTILFGKKVYNEAKLEVTAPENSACVVKVKDSQGNDILSFYIRAGDTVTMGVASQKINVCWATGEVWYGEEYLFGEETHYSKDNESYTLKDGDKLWYDLEPVKNGDFKPEEIDADEF